ncbi:class I SAM-dependent RNA methyltransferase [Georgenia halophila]|uniref:Class I SAM-dependent RNA methyltransferase n=1 Tax=Georgenia halophila TaxID=620889 RepID=A0ABP8LQE5_9MICO
MSAAAEPDRPVVDVGPPAHGGHCVARLDGRVVFVRHALPGERVRLEITDRRSRFWRADAVEILDASADRVPSIWPEAGPGGVGGAELAHVALPAQRDWKRQVLADTLRRIGGEEVAADVAALEESAGAAVPPVAVLGDDDATDGLHTRTRVELTVDAEGRAGMFRFRSHKVLALQHMPLAHEAIAELALLGADSPWRRTWRPGARVEAIAPSSGPPLVLVDGEAASPRKGRRSGPPRRSVREVVPSAVGELAYRVAGAGFWQVHRHAPETLVSAVLSAAGELGGKRVLELYSGAGLLTLPLARSVGEDGAVVSIDGSEDAVRDARRNLHAYPNTVLGKARVDAASVREAAAFDELAAGVGGADVVVLDPPRAGAGTNVVTAVAELAPERVVLVACDPAALARDLEAARRNGYRVTALAPFDLFPHTHHFEIVATLTRR